MVLRHGTWVVPRPRTPTVADLESDSRLPLYEQPVLFGGSKPADDGPGTATVPFAEFLRLAGRRADCFLPIYHDEPIPTRVLLPFYLSDHTVCVRERRLAVMLRRPCAGGVVRTLVDSEPCSTDAADNEGLASLNGSSRLTALSPNLFAVTVRTDRNSVLVTPYAHVDGWRAWVDDRPVPVMRVNAAFVGIRVPPGAHELRVAYSSRMILPAYRVFAATVLALVLVTLARATRAPAWSRWLAAALVTTVGVVAEQRWERELQRRAARPVLLNNDYDGLLRTQLQRWDPRSIASTGTLTVRASTR